MDNGTGRRKPAARRPDSIAAEANFRKRLDELGATLLESEWLGALRPHRVRCGQGHDIGVRPGDIREGGGICRRCTSRRINSSRTQRAEAEFRSRLGAIGATPLYETWLGVGKPHLVRCASGHECRPWPSGLQQGEGICKTCAGNDSAAAEAAFRERLAELGATSLFEKWLGSGVAHPVLCSAGHACRVRPGNVRRWGFCKVCAGKDPAAAEADFRARLAAMGCTPLYETYRGRNKPHHVRCAAGHDCHPHPSSVQRGSGVCLICARRDPATAEAAFREQITRLGGVVLGEYVKAAIKVHVRCPAGHDCYPRPADVQHGIGMCVICAGLDSATAEANFRARLQELGAVPVYRKWMGVGKPHRVRCPAGHDCYPAPGNVRQGQGICLACAGQEHTVFYVLEHATEPTVKFGISSADGRNRLRKHRRDGFTREHLLIADLPEGVARRAEDAVRSTLAIAGEKAVQGREYFNVSCLALILDVADSWLSAPRPDTRRVRTWQQGTLFAA